MSFLGAILLEVMPVEEVRCIAYFRRGVILSPTAPLPLIILCPPRRLHCGLARRVSKPYQPRKAREEGVQGLQGSRRRRAGVAGVEERAGRGREEALQGLQGLVRDEQPYRPREARGEALQALLWSLRNLGLWATGRRPRCCLQTYSSSLSRVFHI